MSESIIQINQSIHASINLYLKTVANFNVLQ